MTNEQLITDLDIAWNEFIDWLEGEALEADNESYV